MIERGRDYMTDLDLDIPIDVRRNLLTALSDKYDINLNTDASYMDGSTCDEYGRIAHTYVGCKETFNSENTTLRSFIMPVIGIYHENAHVQQIRKMSHHNDPLFTCIMMNHYACKCSYNYYKGSCWKNYFNQVKEIAAQYVALHNAYDYFKDLFNDAKLANDTICAYVNTRMGLKSEFVTADKSYTNVGDIYKDFEHAFDVVKNKHKKLSFEDMHDDFSFYLNKHSSVSDKIKTVINNVTANQDLLLTAIYIQEANEGEYVRGLKCFENIEFPFDMISLSRGRYFGKDVSLSKMLNDERVSIMTNTEKSEMLTVYDENLNAIGERTRAEVHANGLLHQTIRLWTIQDNQIWFQKRSENKSLFPGRLDLSATGHIDPDESAESAVLRETSEEIGLDLSNDDLKKLKGIPFPFTRPDGKLDNEFANIFLYKPKNRPHFRISDEVAGMCSVSVQDYDKLLRTGEPIKAVTYKCDPEGKNPPLQTGRITCNADSFCCLNKEEWSLVKDAVGFSSKQRESELSIDIAVSQDKTKLPNDEPMI